MGPEEPGAPETVSFTELRDDLRRIVETAHYFGRRYLIVRNGDPMAVLLGLEDYRRLLDAPGRPVEIDRPNTPLRDRWAPGR